MDPMGCNESLKTFLAIECHTHTHTHTLGGGFKYFLFSPLFGEMIQFDEDIFQMGWNYQLVYVADLLISMIDFEPCAMNACRM